MTITQIEKNLEDLANSFKKESFIFDLLLAFGEPQATISRLQKGEFYINNSTTYYLKPNEYELTVKNCKEKCDIYHTKVMVGDNIPPIKIVLSLDKNGKHIIINQK